MTKNNHIAPQNNQISKNRKNSLLSSSLARLIALLIRRSAQRLTGARSLWLGCKPEMIQRIYYANHSSHIDFILLWSSLPKDVRCKTHPVAASDYWNKDRLRQFLIQDTFNGITIQRNREANIDPLDPIKQILAQGDSIIFFPEGTRNLDDDTELLPFKSGLYHLHQSFPDIEIIPVWISNLKRVMPKGAFIPLPLLSTVCFGTPLNTSKALRKDEFLIEAQQQLLQLKQAENA